MPFTHSAMQAATLAVFLTAGLPPSQPVVKLAKYCEAGWKNAHIMRHDWDDCTQQTLLELLERIPIDRWSEALTVRQSAERQELNRAIWRVSQRWRRARRSGQLPPDVPAEPVPQAVDADVAATLNAAVSRLPKLQADVLQRWSTGESVAQIAANLGLPAARVSDLPRRPT